jgi:hypothetical protein
MLKKMLLPIILASVAYLCYAKGESEKSPQWYEIITGIIAIPSTALGLWFLLVQIKKTRLETQNLQIDLDERRRKLQVNLPGTADDPLVPAEVFQIEKKVIRGLKMRSTASAGSLIFSNVSIGILAFFLPVMMVMVSGFSTGGHPDIRKTMGDYYYSGASVFYIGIHCIIAVLLFFYKANDKAERAVSRIGALFCILIVFCPNNSLALLRTLHYFATSCFFISHAYFSLFVFTKNNGQVYTRQAIFRNQIYKVCGIIIFMCLAMICIIPLLRSRLPVNSTFYLEALMYWAYGLSWLVNGSLILKDRKAATE